MSRSPSLGHEGIEHVFAEEFRDVRAMRVTKTEWQQIAPDMLTEVGECEFDGDGRTKPQMRGKYLALYRMEGETCSFPYLEPRSQHAQSVDAG